MNPPQVAAAASRAKEVAYDFRSLTNAEKTGLAEYRSMWAPFLPERCGYDIDAPEGWTRCLHVRLRRWTARGMGPVEIGIVMQGVMHHPELVGHYVPPVTEGKRLYLSFFHPGCMDLDYPIGSRDEVEVIGKLDPVTMGEFIKDVQHKSSNFAWRAAAHHGNQVAAACTSLWEAVFERSPESFANRDEEVAAAKINAVLEEVGMGWFPSSEGVTYIKNLLDSPR
ncbi:MAG: hypothetical protein Q8O64_14595 [Sideroxyarcus sp.]|nr:hypothetical protein [Sideroxyarcus sp.]